MFGADARDWCMRPSHSAQSVAVLRLPSRHSAKPNQHPIKCWEFTDSKKIRNDSLQTLYKVSEVCISTDLAENDMVWNLDITHIAFSSTTFNPSKLIYIMQDQIKTFCSFINVTAFHWKRFSKENDCSFQTNFVSNGNITWKSGPLKMMHLKCNFSKSTE